jgi:hypothetical protein
LEDVGLGQRSHGWSVLHLHTLRKFFRTEAEIAGMHRPMVDMLLGHKGKGLDRSYWRPREDEVLDAYRRAVSYLIITEAEELRDALERRESEYSVKVMKSERPWMKTEQELQELKDLVKELRESRDGGSGV